MLNRITIVGSGSWATALVKIFAESKIHVSWLVRDAATAEFIRLHGHNPRYLSAASLDLSFIHVTSIHADAFAGSSLVVFAIPSAYLQDTLEDLGIDLIGQIPVAVSIKGFVPGTGLTPSRFVATQLGRNENDLLVIGGPCHAEEIANNRNTYLTIAGQDQPLVEAICERLSCPYVRAIQSLDPAGIEYAAILKNVIAVASGIAQGLLYGDNFQAVLVANSMGEASRLINSIEPGTRNLFQSAYFGDLLVTAYSDFSRNRTLGKLIGRGYAVNKALQAMEMVAEGFNASKELEVLLKNSALQTPVFNSVYRILHKHSNPFNEFKLLESQFS
ncbi:MAG: NAD(P)H-dependent glycerol-3-phosphate dehydrogenase [Chitinophagaceae bacterium]